MQPQNGVEEEDSVPQDGQSEEMESGRAQHLHHYAKLDFAERRPAPAPPSEMYVVKYAEINEA